MTSSSRATRTANLEVLLQDASVGTLFRDPGGTIWFEPDRAWIAGGQRPPLGLAFLRDPAPRAGRAGVPSWFDNLLPEAGSPLRQRIARQSGLRETNTLALLRELGMDLPGAVVIRGQDVGDHATDPSPIVPGRFRFSLAGVQLKLSMVRGNDRFALPVRGETGHWIVKVPGSRLTDLPSVEHATMEWARATGFPVPATLVAPADVIHGVDPDLVENVREIFAVERFDRASDGRRIHQEDFAQALEVDAVHKYADTSGRRTSYDSLARLVADACGPSGRSEFVERVAFVLASGNGDAHLKNWSFQWGPDGRPSLSPVYDQVATVTWPDIDGWDRTGGAQLALALGKTRAARDIDLKRVQAFCDRAGCAEEVDRFLDTLERAMQAWPGIEARAPAAMRAAIATHWKNVPVLQQVASKSSSTGSRS